MPTKSKKSRPNKSRLAKKAGNQKASKNTSGSAKTEVDLLSPAAMENVYYISHNAVDCLQFRGFGWPNSTKKKKKKGTKRKKKT
ncbi:hypothetical protein Q5P01_003503 [Channa striata]|uniref:Small lysine-rich protein 1 n=1 Tax=Channa striata TaxID=64152 RepID=A0AA88T0D4_CHASR|nr:hypothetical protein Q5P01_003503 [Channa striata]